VLEAAGMVPSPLVVPVGLREFFLLAVGPGHVMPAVVQRQVEAVGFVVGGDDEAEDVEHIVFAQVLLVDPKHVLRRPYIFVWS